MRCAIWLGLLALGGCVDDLGSRTVVDEPRVIAARGEIEGAEDGAASAVPGETVRVRHRIVAGGADPATTYHLIACAEAPSRVGPSECASAPFAESLRLEPAADDPIFELEAPALAALGPGGRILVRGVFCIGGVPEGPTACEGDDPWSMRVRYAVQVVEPGAPRNHHPGLEGLAMEGTPWSATRVPDPEAPCEGGDLLTVRSGDGPRRLSLGAAGASFEPLPADAGTEAIQVSHQATAGELDQAFSFLADPFDLAEVAWTPPEAAELPVGGRIVRFWHVATDQRGGVDWIEAALCAVP